jgi:hypothetical protein
MLSEHFGTAADAGTRLLAKNPDAFFWPHLASIHVQRAIHCSTKLLVLLRDPVQRTLSHFGWYWRKMAGAPGASHNITAVFGHWLDLSFDAYAAQLRQFTDDSEPHEKILRWSELCYGLEGPEQRKHWAPFLGVIEPSKMVPRTVRLYAIPRYGTALPATLPSRLCALLCLLRLSVTTTLSCQTEKIVISDSMGVGFHIYVPV